MTLRATGRERPRGLQEGPARTRAAAAAARTVACAGRGTCDAPAVYEHRTARPLPLRTFLGRLAVHAAFAGGVVAFSLLLGMAGSRVFERLSWTDAFLNSAMLLGGMGPVDPPRTEAGKLFAGCYALYAGLVFLVVVGIAFAPLAHRLLHVFHWEEAGKRR